MKFFPLRSYLLLVVTLATFGSKFVQANELTGFFTRFTSVPSNSRTPISRTPNWDVGVVVPEVSQVRVRHIRHCSSPMLWDVTGVQINGGEISKNSEAGVDERGDFILFRLGYSVDVATVRFYIASMAVLHPCAAATVEFLGDPL